MSRLESSRNQAWPFTSVGCSTSSPNGSAVKENGYPTKAAYVAAVKKATEVSVKQRTLLPADAAFLINQAESEGIRPAP